MFMSTLQQVRPERSPQEIPGSTYLWQRHWQMWNVCSGASAADRNFDWQQAAAVANVRPAYKLIENCGIAVSLGAKQGRS